MDVLTITATILRRWRIVVPLLAVTAVMMASVVITTDQEYEMSGSYLVGPMTLAGTEGQEPRAVDDDGQGVGRAVAPGVNSAVIAEEVQSGEVHEQVQAAGGASDYDVRVDDALLRVVATSSNREQVVPTVNAVMEEIKSAVARRQDEAGVDEARRVTVEPLSTPTNASVRSEGDEGYSAVGSVRLTSPDDTEVSNPYEDYAFSVRIVQELLYSAEGTERIAAAGGQPEPLGDDDRGFAVEYDWDDPAPVGYVSVAGTDPDAVERTYDAVVEVASEELTARQDGLGIVAEQRVDLHDLAPAPPPQPQGRGLMRPLATMAAVGIVAAFGVALLVDNVAQARRRRAELDSESAEFFHTMSPNGELEPHGHTARQQPPSMMRGS